MEREGAPRGPSDCPQRSQGKRRLDQWPVGPEGEGGEREREEDVVKRIGAGRAGVPWVWDPKSSHHPRLLTGGWESGGERWGWQGSVVKVIYVLSWKEPGLRGLSTLLTLEAHGWPVSTTPTTTRESLQLRE